MPADETNPASEDKLDEKAPTEPEPEEETTTADASENESDPADLDADEGIVEPPDPGFGPPAV